MNDKLIPERKRMLLDFISDPTQITQGQHRLSWGDDCFCIEGAFCEIYRRHNPENSKWVEDPDQPGYFWFELPKELPYIEEAPPAVWQWFGLEMGTSPKVIWKPEYNGEEEDNLTRCTGHYMSFPELNDRGVTFEDFKKIIGEQL